MYSTKDGILIKNGRKTFAVGESYYPSFHPGKFPVPPDGDRIGEMKKDLKMMHDYGINHVRYAAIGLTELDENGNLVIDTPFVDAMIEEADKNDISVSVRLQGYAVNLRNFKDVMMIDNVGNVQNGHWADFIQTTLHHEGLLEDLETATKGLAQHYDVYPNVIGYQIYNEPHFPERGLFDYHPIAINAYKKYLVEKGYMTAEEAENYEPPHFRDEQTPEDWARWRIFCRESLTNFLNIGSRAAHAVSDRATFTCLTADQGALGNPTNCIDVYANAREMSLLGYTCYRNSEGADYYCHEYNSSILNSASRAADKEVWCIELDSRTYIPTRIFNKNTYLSLGSGVKGIVYYQWRGDAPSPATPIPNGCGVLNYDGSKTENFENAKQMIDVIHDLNDYLVNAKRVGEGVAILQSDYADDYADAVCNTFNKTKMGTLNSNVENTFKVYSDLRRLGYGTWIIDEAALRENKLGIDTLFVGVKEWLAPSEVEAINEFIEKGGKVYRVSDSRRVGFGYLEFNEEKEVYTQHYRIEDIMYLRGKTPLLTADSGDVATQHLGGDGFNLISVVNTTYPQRVVSTKIKCGFDVNQATAYSVEKGVVELEVVDNEINVGEVEEGCIIITK